MLQPDHREGTARTEPYRIVILEDEFIIAESLARHLRKHKHEVIGYAISFEEARELCEREPPDIFLLDIRVSGPRNGIDFAHYLREHHPQIPFIFLTSQVDTGYLDAVMKTMPSGCLSKPIQVKSLLATIEIAMFNHRSRKNPKRVLSLRDGKSTHRIQLDQISYVEADHVYVVVHLVDESDLTLRIALSDLIAEVGEDVLLQTHRSFAVNPAHVNRYERDHVYIGNRAVPVSRGRRQSVAARL